MIWITQFLCPDRHCAIAAVWDDAEQTAEGVEQLGWESMARANVNGWCGIDGGALTPEHTRTAYATVEEAMPLMAESQRHQLATRQLLDALGLTHDVRRRAARRRGAAQS